MYHQQYDQKHTFKNHQQQYQLLEAEGLPAWLGAFGFLVLWLLEFLAPRFLGSSALWLALLSCLLGLAVGLLPKIEVCEQNGGERNAREGRQCVSGNCDFPIEA